MSATSDRFGSIEAIVLDCVIQHNKATVTIENYTMRLAASVMIMFHDKGADKTAGNEVRRVVGGLKSEAYGKQISAWVTGNYVRYADALRRTASMAPMARVQAMLAAIGDRPWRDVRSEHKVTGNSGPKSAPADNPPSSAKGAKGSDPLSSHDAMNVILKAIPLLETKQDVMNVLAALRAHLETMDTDTGEVLPRGQIAHVA